MPSPSNQSAPEQENQFEARLAKVEAELALWRNLQVAPESGGGGIQFGGTSVVLRINSLTDTSAQMP